MPFMPTTRQRISAVFLFAIASVLASNDSAAIVGRALKPLAKGRQPAIIDLVDARKMLEVVEEQPSLPVTKLALRLLALTAVRINRAQLVGVANQNRSEARGNSFFRKLLEQI